MDLVAMGFPYNQALSSASRPTPVKTDLPDRIKANMR
jgi:hypothetical protein